MKLRIFVAVAALFFSLEGQTGSVVSPIPLTTTPASPNPNQTFAVTYQLQQCGFFFPGQPPASIEIVGNVIRIVAFVEGNACIPGQPFVSSFTWQVGPVLTSGTYQLELYGYGATPPSNQVLLARGTVTVSGVVMPSPEAIPASSTWSMLILLSLAVGTSAIFLTGSRSRA